MKILHCYHLPIGHFRVAVNLILKVRLSEAKLFNCLLLGPVRTTRNYVRFAKKSVSTKPFLVRTIFFSHENFRKCHQTSKMPSTSFGGRDVFVRRGNPLFLDIYPSSGHHI